MQRGFGGGEFEPAKEERRDKEVTLGPIALTGIGIGLFVLCALFFALGFAVGRHVGGAAATAAQPAPGQSVATTPSSSLSKPTAASTISTVQPTIADMQQVTPTPGNQSANPLTSYAPAGSTTTNDASQLLVRPALGGQSGSAQITPVAASTGAQVQPAIAQAAALMVQVAAVSHVEDARVLVNALHQRGFAVTARELADGLIHVQVGPFANRADANAMCQKLLSDGYNAVVQP